ncbi:hypothetical protein [Bacillus altitudinis]|nr:hypothetical protein [Bacillus altitudinis]
MGDGEEGNRRDGVELMDKVFLEWGVEGVEGMEWEGFELEGVGG